MVTDAVTWHFSFARLSSWNHFSCNHNSQWCDASQSNCNHCNGKWLEPSAVEDTSGYCWYVLLLLVQRMVHLLGRSSHHLFFSSWSPGVCGDPNPSSYCNMVQQNCEGNFNGTWMPTGISDMSWSLLFCLSTRQLSGEKDRWRLILEDDF